MKLKYHNNSSSMSCHGLFTLPFILLDKILLFILYFIVFNNSMKYSSLLSDLCLFMYYLVINITKFINLICAVGVFGMPTRILHSLTLCFSTAPIGANWRAIIGALYMLLAKDAPWNYQLRKKRIFKIGPVEQKLYNFKDLVFFLHKTQFLNVFFMILWVSSHRYQLTSK